MTPAWTGPHRHPSGAKFYRVPSTDWLITDIKAAGVNLYREDKGGLALVSVKFVSVATAQAYVARQIGGAG